MDLPVMPPVEPMLAKAVSGIPAAEGLIFEPKWDGFRCIAFVDDHEIVLGSRNGKPLTRYFPDVVDALRANIERRCVLDGEIVIATEHGLDFDLLSQRIHPAASRVTMLASQTPAAFVAFDLLAVDDTDLRSEPFATRRERLEVLLSAARSPIYITPTTTDHDVAARWFDHFEGAGLDGLIAKQPDLAYMENKRSMQKIKHERTADCVVGGFRWHKSGPIIGSLMLGLYDADGNLRHLGITSSFTMARRKELVAELEPYRARALEGHPWAGWMGGIAEPSRWNAKKDLSWEPVRAELVVEVAYDHLQNERFRHATTFKRWRADRSPNDCTYDQLETPVPAELSEIFSGG